MESCHPSSKEAGAGGSGVRVKYRLQNDTLSKQNEAKQNQTCKNYTESVLF